MAGDSIQLRFDETRQALRVLHDKRESNLAIYGNLADIKGASDLSRKVFYVDRWPEFSCLLCIAAISPKINVLQEGQLRLVYLSLYCSSVDGAIRLVKMRVVDAGYSQIVFHSTPVTLLEEIWKILKKSGYKHDKTDANFVCKTYVARPSTADHPISLPSGYTVRPLDVEDLPVVLQLYESTGCDDLKDALEDMIVNYDTLGVVIGKQLVGFFIESDFGMLKGLVISEAHKKRGLGSYLASALANLVRNHRQVDPYVIISVNNVASERAFTKAGYGHIDGPLVATRQFHQGRHVLPYKKRQD